MENHREVVAKKLFVDISDRSCSSPSHVQHIRGAQQGSSSGNNNNRLDCFCERRFWCMRHNHRDGARKRSEKQKRCSAVMRFWFMRGASSACDILIIEWRRRLWRCTAVLFASSGAAIGRRVFDACEALARVGLATPLLVAKGRLGLGLAANTAQFASAARVCGRAGIFHEHVKLAHLHPPPGLLVFQATNLQPRNLDRSGRCHLGAKPNLPALATQRGARQKAGARDEAREQCSRLIMGAHPRVCGSEQCLAGRRQKESECCHDEEAAQSRTMAQGDLHTRRQFAAAVASRPESCLQQRAERGRDCGGAAAASRRCRRSLVTAAVVGLMLAAGVSGQSPKKLENNGGHFRFGNIRW